MKLDKIKFARLISYLSRNAGGVLCDTEIEAIDSLIDINVEPVQIPGKANPRDLDELMRLMVGGQIGTKIEAIKLYRTITGCMLKESKDAVEAHWVNKLQEPAVLSDILNCGPVNFDKFEG